MKVTLVYSGISGKGFNSIGQGMDSGWISHALSLLSSVCKQAGHEVDLIDLRCLRGWDHFREEIERRRPSVLTWGMMSVDFDYVVKCTEIVKEVDPSIVTVVGGTHPTIMLHEVRPVETIDHIITHEAEISLPQLLSDLDAGRQPERIIRGVQPDLDSLPFCDRELFLDEWRRFGYDTRLTEVGFGEFVDPFVTVIAGRGCIYKCSFCMPAENAVYGGKVRRRGVDNVVAELEELRDKYHFRSLFIHDQCLTEDKEWVYEFCRQYRARGFTAPWACQTRADITARNEDLVRTMREAGLMCYFIGFESGSQRMLNFVRKGTTVEQNLAAARMCHQYGIQIWANYMFGLPTETRDDVVATVRMIKEIDPDFYSPTFYTPHPGTDLFAWVEQEGLSLVKDHTSYRRNPEEAKVKGVDYDLVRWAVEESQRPLLKNYLRRTTRRYWQRYANPRKVARKIGRLATAGVGAVVK